MQKLIKNSYIVGLIALSCLSSSQAETEFQEIKEAVKNVVEKHTLEKQEFKPIIYTDIQRDSNSRKNINSNSKFRKVSFKNEFFQSIKVTLNSPNDFKIIYLNPYEKIDDIPVNKKEDYKVKVFDLNEKYLGNLIRTDLQKKDLVRISPFLIFPELVQDGDTEVIQVEETISNEKTESSPIKTETVISSLVQPKEIEIAKKINPLKPEPLNKATDQEELGNQFKIANISDYKVKISIKKANGESIGTNWTIDNDVYSPEPLKFASKPVILEPDTNINITYLDKDDHVKKELSLPAKNIPKDPHNNYTYFIENIASD